MTQEQPPDSPGFLYRFFRARRRGRLIILAILIALALFGTLSPPTTPSTPSSTSSTPSPLQLTAFPDAHTTPPTDTVTITLTWDEWQDLLNALHYVRSDIDVTFDFVGDNIPPSTAGEAQLAAERFEALSDKVLDAGVVAGETLSDKELDAMITRQLQRRDQLADLMTDLFNLKLDYLLSPTPQPKKTK